MKKSVKRFVLLSLIVVLVTMSITGCGSEPTGQQSDESNQQSNLQLTMGTYGPSGGYMLLATGIAKIINENVEGVNFTPVPSPRGSVENVETVNSQEREFGLAASNVVVNAITPREPFTEKQDIMGWFVAHHGITYSIALESSNIKSFKDLEGKKVAIGAPGSDDEFLAENVFLPAAGVDISKVKIERVAMTEAANLMKDGHIDAFIGTGAPKLATIAELASSREIRFIPMEESAIDKVLEDYTEFVVKEIKDGDIDNLIMDEPSYKVIAMNHIAIVHPSVDEDMMYDFTKAVFENLDVIHEIKEEFKVITLENALNGMPCEVHPGALRYFKEVGIVE